MNAKKLDVVYVLPSRYDDDGYVHRYGVGVLPSNTLQCLRGLTRAVADSGELGDDVEISVAIYDDTVQRVPIKRIARNSRNRGAELLVGMVAVQTNQFARACDLALEFRQAGAQAMIGGFHVSGVLSVYKEPSPEMQRMMDQGVTMVAGEVEGPGVLGGILRDALNGGLKSVYNYLDHPPDITEAPIPEADMAYLKRFAGRMGTLDTSRGCPFNCSFCTIINVQGKKMRHRSVACMLESIKESYDKGVRYFFFTDDNVSRSPIWRELFGSLAELRAQGTNIQFMMQVDTQAWRIKDFGEMAEAAGCFLAFIGMETINEANLAAIDKPQNKVHQYEAMVEAFHRWGILVHVGYIIGMPHDTTQSVRRDIVVLKDQIKVDQASFFMLTPLPGSRDHQRMIQDGTPMDADLNNFDGYHETFSHPHLEPGEWRALYDEAWDTFYSKENVENVLLRTDAKRYWRVFWLSIYNRHATLFRSHPMVAGFLRRKGRKERRPIFPRESVPRYYWRRSKDTLDLAKVVLRLFFEYQEIWLLTRKTDDPRSAILADLRAKWAEIREYLHSGDLGDKTEEAAQKIRALLHTAAERIQDLWRVGGTGRKQLQRRLQPKVKEVLDYLRAFEAQKPTRQSLLDAERFITENLLRGYEELAIGSIALRRHYNAYRHDLVARFKSGRLMTFSLLFSFPRAVLVELVLGLRFAYAFIHATRNRLDVV